MIINIILSCILLWLLVYFITPHKIIMFFKKQIAYRKAIKEIDLHELKIYQKPLKIISKANIVSQIKQYIEDNELPYEVICDIIEEEQIIIIKLKEN